MKRKRICVYCGSSMGANRLYREKATELGTELARRGVGLVYGGGNVGLMGVVADAALAAGGEVIGVIPQALMARELGHGGVTELHVVASMHDRKALMASLSDAFIALPGGFGTLEELCEALTWGQLGIHEKPCGLLDVEGFFAPFLTFLDHVAQERFLRPEHRALLLSHTDSGALIEALEAFVPPKIEKWLHEDET